MADLAEPALVPELLVSDLDASLRFWRDLCGFTVQYDRPEERFAYLARGIAHLMLDQIGVGRDWITGELTPPLGRGVNFQVTVEEIGPILQALQEADVPLFLEPEVRWYRVDDDEIVMHQFAVMDPDGYLVRFQSAARRRPASST